MAKQQQISRRDYFAAHAPAEIPEWFKADRPERPKMPDESHLSEREVGTVGWVAGGDGDWTDDLVDLPERIAPVKAAIAARSAYYEARRRWEYERETRRYVAWRVAYANMMVEAMA